MGCLVVAGFNKSQAVAVWVCAHEAQSASGVGTAAEKLAGERCVSWNCKLQLQPRTHAPSAVGVHVGLVYVVALEHLVLVLLGKDGAYRILRDSVVCLLA